MIQSKSTKFFLQGKRLLILTSLLFWMGSIFAQSKNCRSDFKFEINQNTKTVTLKAESNRSPAVFGFKLGDGTFTRGQKITHTYAKAGDYKICLTTIAFDSTSNQRCTTEVCKKITIVDCDRLKANFRYVVDGLTVKLVGETNSNNVSTGFRFGDGQGERKDEVKHTYAKPGTYEVCLVVYALNATNDQVCTTKVCKKITVEDDNDCRLRAKFEFRQDGNAFKFFAKANQSPAKFEWNFGDGNDTTGDEVKHEYRKPGVYRVCVTAYTRGDEPGEVCKTTYCQKVEVKRPDCDLKADYGFDKDGLTIKLKARANEDNLHYFWALGDGNDATGKLTRHTFDKPGKYEVCLIVFNPKTKCKVCICKTIIVEKPCRLKADFKLRQADEKIAVKARSNGSKLAKYYWDFGDGTTAKGKFARHKYTKKGIYVVTLWVADRTKGCKIEVQKRVAVGVKLTTPQVALVANNNTTQQDDVQQEVPTWEAKVSPSPARNQVKVSSEDKEVAKVEIFNTDGVVVKKDNENNLQNVDISLLPAGFYYAHVYASDGTKTIVKFLKN